MVNLLYHYLEITETPESIYQIVEFLSELWFNLSATRLKLQALPLHLSIIKTFFHPKVVFSKVDEMKKKKKKILLLVICYINLVFQLLKILKLEEVFTNFNFMFIKLSNSKSKTI